MRLFSFTFLVICFNFLNAQTLDLETFATGFTDPLTIANAGDERLFVMEQGGVIKIVQPDGTVNPTPFLDISNLTNGGGERGLLGLAFDPDYATNGNFYVNYTNNSGDTVIANYTVSANPDVANTQGTILLTIDQPFGNHNGGCILFGPDGYLWISMGDGGSGGDPQDNAQDNNDLLGKMLRIDVDGDQYTIPTDNPFVAGGGQAEIWSTGLRNAWKFSFDAMNGDAWIADVGQGQIEEINTQPFSDAGLNYGWRCYEGNNEFNFDNCSTSTEFIFPIATYGHTGGRCSVTGGYVYRGAEFPNLIGKYIFADFCTSEFGTLDNNTISWHGSFAGVLPAGFGEDVNGELYVAGLQSGIIYKIVDSSMSVVEQEKWETSISPNPFKDKLQINSSHTFEKVYIYNMDGKEVFHTSNNSTSIEINLQNLPIGNYVMQLYSGNKIQSFKILKK